MTILNTSDINWKKYLSYLTSNATSPLNTTSLFIPSHLRKFSFLRKFGRRIMSPSPNSAMKIISPPASSGDLPQATKACKTFWSIIYIFINKFLFPHGPLITSFECSTLHQYRVSQCSEQQQLKWSKKHEVRVKCKTANLFHNLLYTLMEFPKLPHCWKDIYHTPTLLKVHLLLV